MKSRIKRTILQIIPADGWQVVYDEYDKEVVNRIACFALIEEVEVDSDGKQLEGWLSEPLRYVAAMDVTEDGEISEVTEAKNFLRVERCLPHERWRSVEKIKVIN